MEPQNYISMASVALAALVALFGGFRFVTAQVESLRREIASAEEKARLLVEKAAESESKQRHTLANTVQSTLASIQLEMRALQREAVRHEQMEALESRLNASLTKIETKVDRLAETAGKIVMLEQALSTLTGRIEKVADKLEARTSQGRT